MMNTLLCISSNGCLYTLADHKNKQILVRNLPNIKIRVSKNDELMCLSNSAYFIMKYNLGKIDLMDLLDFLNKLRQILLQYFELSQMCDDSRLELFQHQKLDDKIDQQQLKLVTNISYLQNPSTTSMLSSNLS